MSAPFLQTDRATLWHGRAEEVYPFLEPGFTLAVLDGPYGLGMGDGWDEMGVDGLADWYRPHLEAVSALMAPSASLYLWNTAEGWARLDPEMRGLGWRFGALLTWLKTNPVAQKGMGTLRCWPDFTEVCGVYQREELAPLGGPAQFVAYAAGASEGNTIRKWLHAERERAGLTGDELEAAVNEAGGKGNMVCRHSFTESQWCLPTWEQWQALHRAWNEHGRPEGQPYLQRDRSRTYDLDEQADHEALRAEYEALRAPFAMPAEMRGIGNVWVHPIVPPGERLVAPGGETHPCQKPLLFAERIVRASSRPGDRVLSVFSGTCREAVACRRLPPDEARHCVAVEPDERWLHAVRGCLAPDYKPIRTVLGQVGLFA